MPEDQIPETVKDIVHIAKKESQPWFNEISGKVRATAKLVILKEDNDTKNLLNSVENTGDN